MSILLIAPISKKEQEKVEVTIEENNSGDKKVSNGRDVQIKELGTGAGETPKSYYWGIGVSGEYGYSPVGFAYRISEVYKGYAADSVGLLPGDYIFEVNGGSPAVNDISGDGPLKLVLQIYRNGVIMQVNTERTKIWY